ncbi:MAG: HAMP domain-containing protein [Betaproteobacteria bacterium]|nr:HAMP domain-containing protein [Betaproteobacteria bacterium]
MKLRLWQRLFLALAALAVAAVGTMFAVQQRTFRQDFLEYSDRLILVRLQGVATRMGDRYAEAGGWDFIVRRPQVFNDLLDGGDGRAASRRPEPGYGPGPPPGRITPESARGGPPDRDGPAARPAPEKGPPRKELDPLNYRSRVKLVSAEGHHLIGNPAVLDGGPAIPVVSGGQQVGRLIFSPAQGLASDADLAFVAKQARHALGAALGVLAVALLVAWALARWIRRPLSALADGANRLAAGEYAMRIDARRQDELGDLARDFNRLAETLEQSRQARRRWGADIAHELRTPLAILRGEIQAMQDGVRPLDARGLASLQAECDRLARLVEDLYQLSVAEAGGLEYRWERIDLAALLREVHEDHAPRLALQGLEFQLEQMGGVSAHIRGDERRLMQLFANLLTNVQRYTDAPGQVVMRIMRAGDAWRVELDDSPPGVAPEHLPHLFDRLYRVEGSRNRAEGGAGLGLSICRSIMEAHGGSIEAASSPLGGLRICLSFPVPDSKA